MINPKKSRTLLDDIDLKIVAELEVNARQTTRELAAKLDISATTVSKRIRIMVEDGDITFCTIGDPFSLGFPVRFIGGLNVTSKRLREVHTQLQSHTCVQAITLTTGRYDMVVYALFRDTRELMEWITGDLGGITDITTIEKMVVLDPVKRSYMYLHEDGQVGKNTSPRRLDESELRLVAALELNPRESVGVLGKKIGLSRQETAHRLSALLSDGIIKVMSVAKPMALGFAFSTYIFVKVRRDRIIPVAAILAAKKKVRHVGILGGPFDILVYMAFRDTEEMARFLIDELGGISGVINSESMIHLVESYRSYRTCHTSHF